MSASVTLMAGGTPAVLPGPAEGPAGEAAAVDLALVERARAGDNEAFAILVERNRRAVYRAAYAALGSAGDAEDVAQEAFIAAYRRLRGFRGQAAFRTWVLAIAWRKALDRRRSVVRWLRLSPTRERGAVRAADPVERVPSPRTSQEEQVAARELHALITQLVRSLPRTFRDALLLSAAGEYSYDEIGRMLGVPTGTVKWRVSEARRLLRQKLASKGYAHD